MKMEIDFAGGEPMTAPNVLHFPMRNPELFSPEINSQLLTASEFSRILGAAILALPHIQDSHIREELKDALCDLFRIEEETA
jgi:hypothetical protein